MTDAMTFSDMIANLRENWVCYHPDIEGLADGEVWSRIVDVLEAATGGHGLMEIWKRMGALLTTWQRLQGER